jgi:hypothetical protein
MSKNSLSATIAGNLAEQETTQPEPTSVAVEPKPTKKGRARREAFSGDSSWSFNTGSYEGEVTIGVEFTYAFSALRRLDVSVG